MNRRTVWVYVAVGLAFVGVWLLSIGIARADDSRPSPHPVGNLLSVPGAVVTPTLNLSETLSSTPVYTVHVSEGMTTSLPLGVSNPLTSPAQVTITVELVEVVRATTGGTALDMFGLSPESQAVAAQGAVTFTLSLVKPLSATESYTGMLKLSTAGPGLTPTKTITQPFGLRVSVRPEERGAEVITPTLPLRLVGSEDELLSSPPVYRVRVSDLDDQRWQSTSLGVHNLASEELTIVAGPLEVASGTGESVPATLGLLPVSQTVAADDVVTFTLFLVEGWLPEGSYAGSLTLSTVVTEPATVQEEFVLLVTPWLTELEWTQKELIHVVDEEHNEATVWVMARNADAEGVKAELAALAARDRVTETFDTADFLTITAPGTLTKDKATKLTLKFTTDELPEPGTYEGALRLSASNAAAVTKTFTLVVPEDRARGSYEIAYAEVGRAPELTPSLPLTTALEFTGVRWLPGSTRVAGGSWPIVAGASLLGIALTALLAYAGRAWFGSARRWFLDKEPKAQVLDGVKRHWSFASLVVVGLLLVAVRLIVGGPMLDSITQAHVGSRTLLIREIEGRGPVRDVTVHEAEIANEIGDTGWISVGEHGGEIGAREVMAVPVNIVDLSQPGTYVGHILIQSPDIAGGVAKVPVQVTVHDFILWPSLAILLGVALGGYVKHQKGIASTRLDKRRAIEKARQQWDDYLFRDKYRVRDEWSQKPEMNPLYEGVYWKLDGALRLLAQDAEWGARNADDAVTQVGEWLATYKLLAKAVADIEDVAAIWEVESVEFALCQGELDEATDLFGKMYREMLPRCINQLREKVKEVQGDEAKAAIEALLTKAEELCQAGGYGQAWQQFKKAEFKIRAQGIKTPRCSPPVPSQDEVLRDRIADLRGALGEFDDQAQAEINALLTKAEELLEQRKYDEAWKAFGKAFEKAEGIELREWIKELREKVKEVQGNEAKAAIGALLTKAEELREQRKYDEAWQECWAAEERFAEAEGAYLEQVERRKRPQKKPRKPEYAISCIWYRRCEGDTIFLSADYLGKSEFPNRDFKWEVYEPGKKNGNKCNAVHFTTRDGDRTTAVLQKEGHWVIDVQVSKGGKCLLAEQRPRPLPFEIKPSFMEEIYRDRRRQGAGTQLAAGLIALVGGMVAQKVFSLTFGSIEEYLLAFAWGAGVNAGVEAVAGMSKGFNTMLAKVFPK